MSQNFIPFYDQIEIFSFSLPFKVLLNLRLLQEGSVVAQALLISPWDIFSVAWNCPCLLSCPVRWGPRPVPWEAGSCTQEVYWRCSHARAHGGVAGAGVGRGRRWTAALQPCSHPASRSASVGALSELGKDWAFPPPRRDIGGSCSWKKVWPWTSCLSSAQGKSWRGTQLRAAASSTFSDSRKWGHHGVHYGPKAPRSWGPLRSSDLPLPLFKIRPWSQAVMDSNVSSVAYYLRNHRNTPNSFKSELPHLWNGANNSPYLTKSLGILSWYLKSI